MASNIATNLLKGASNENNLYSLMGIEEDVNPLSYTNVPAFEQKTKKPYQTVILHLRNQEDLDKLADLLEMPNLKLDGKRDCKTAWYPALVYGERGQNSLCVWMDENDPDVAALIQEEEK